MNRSIVTVLLSFLISVGTFAQVDDLLSGPMLGYNALREVSIWVQAQDESDITIKYWPSSDRSVIKVTKPIATLYEKANTATVTIGYLEPGTTYTYQILVNGNVARSGKEYMFTTQKLWQWRESPPKFSFVAGSCMFVNEEKYDRPGRGYGQGNTIFNAIEKEDADFMMWLGDNVYFREVDWDSRSGIYYRYTHMRQVPEIQGLMHKMHHYAIWDDHDYGDNDSDWTYRNKDITLEAFKDFWANPNYGLGGSDGITGSFWWNDCQFFLLDNRWYRTPQATDGEIIGEPQMTWLIESLRASRANFKFVCIGGQVVSDYAKYENHAIYADEQERLLSLIDQYDIKNVIFLDGDRHSSELSKHVGDSGNVVYDITSSPLTSGSYDHDDEPNTKRIGNTIGIQNYAVITIEGTFKNRKATLVYKDAEGKVISTYPLGFT